jgi:exopolysaccharide biosynthesis protein
VVDGRQPGYSEGVSLQELAELMQLFGCWDALNLDGGGSTIMLLGEDPDQLQIMNRPSDKNGPRPVPVMLGIRRK